MNVSPYRWLVVMLVAASLPLAPKLIAQPFSDNSKTICALPKLPEGAAVKVIGDDLVANGLPVSIAEVRHAMSNAELVRYFRALWAQDPDKPPLYIEYPMGVWSVIAHRNGPCFYTLQVRTEAMLLPALAILGVGRPDEVAVSSALPPLDLPVGEVLSHTRSQDQGRVADTWVLATTDTAGGLAQSLNSRMSLDGWQLLMARGSDPDSSPIDSDSRVMIYQRGMEDLGVAIGPGPRGASAVVTHVLRGAQ